MFFFFRKQNYNINNIIKILLFKNNALQFTLYSDS